MSSEILLGSKFLNKSLEFLSLKYLSVKNEYSLVKANDKVPKFKEYCLLRRALDVCSSIPCFLNDSFTALMLGSLKSKNKAGPFWTASFLFVREFDSC